MATHLVKCLKCGKMFDANTVPFEKPRSNRYAHIVCPTDGDNSIPKKELSQEEKDRLELVDYITKLFGDQLSPRAWKQMDEFKKEYKYTYSGMLKTLKWWYELKGNSIEKSYGGIGIIPYVYNEASQYYYALYLAALANQDKMISTNKVREFIIAEPTIPMRPPRLFNLGED